MDLDFRATGALCVEHLAKLGHRDIAVIGEAPAVYERHTGFAERTLDGLRSRAQELGVRLLHRPCEGGYDAMAVTLARVLDERLGTTGFVVQNESAVEPLLALLRQQGRAVPEDVSVVAICPDQVAVQASVRLTSVAIPAQEMGRRRRGASDRQARRQWQRRSRADRARVDGPDEHGTGSVHGFLTPPTSPLPRLLAHLFARVSSPAPLLASRPPSRPPLPPCPPGQRPAPPGAPVCLPSF